MRIEVTLRTAEGVDHDIAMTAPGSATIAELLPFITASGGGEDGGLWAGDHRLDALERLDAHSVRRGMVLTVGGTGRAQLTRDCVLWLEVVGGPDAGRTLALTRGTFTLGRSGERDLALSDPAVSRWHATITVTADGVTVRDSGSANGSWLDGTAVGTSGTGLPPGAMLRLGDSFLAITGGAESAAATRPGPDATRWVNRSPRLLQSAGDAVIEMPELTHPDRPQRVPWAAALIPVAAGVVLSIAVHAPQFMLFVILSPVVLLTTALGDRVHWRRGRRRQAATHRRHAAEARARVVDAAAEETCRRRARDPDAAALLRIAQGPGARLWERRRADPDLMRIRLGLGPAASSTRIRRGNVIEPAARLDSVPLCVDLRDGPFGIAAPPGVARAVARWALAQLAVLVSPADLDVALLLSGEAAPAWQWARWLPHLRGRVAVSSGARQELVDELQDIVDARVEDRANGTAPWQGRWLVVVLDRFHDLGEVRGVSSLLARGPAVGVTAICIDDQANRLPPACGSVARAVDETGNHLALAQPFGARVVVADQVAAGWAESTARALASLGDPDADTESTIPNGCRLVDLLTPSGVDVEGLLAVWRRNDGTPSTVLGLGTDGPVELDLVRDGPHALIAGTTGSGKSELLQSLVAGLAVSCSPEELCFLLIDYKGGAAFADCARLPHTVGLVTDLDAHLTARALQSLDSELRHREALFAAVSAKDLAAYRTAEREQTVPRLVIVVDEFAALADEVPEFVSGLVSIAQRGRSLGIHLVLATQRPGGVVSPEIRANAALRVALRMTDGAESCDVIGTAAAATIDRRLAGRAYLRTGSNVVALQTARVAVPARPRDLPVTVVELDEWARTVQDPEPAQGGPTDLGRIVDAACEAVARTRSPAPRRPWLPPLPARVPCADLASRAAPSTCVTASEPGRITTVPLALLDLPAARQQVPLMVDLAAGDSVLITGAARSGRTSALITLAASAARRSAPEDLHLYAIDCGGGALGTLAGLPHVATLASGEEFDTIDALIRRLNAEASRRTRWLAAHGHGSCAEAVAAGSPMPLVLLLLDGWEGFVDMSDGFDAGRSVDVMLSMIRSAPAAGFTVALAGDRATLAARVAGAVTTRLLLRLADRSDFGLSGIPMSAVPEYLPPGRALRTSDGAELQVAHLGKDPSRVEQERVIAAITARWTETAARQTTAPDSRRGAPGLTTVDDSPYAAPIRLRALPARIARNELPGAAGLVRLGVGGDTAEPIAIDLFTGGARLLIAGPTRSGRTTALRSILAEVRACPVAVVVAAPQRSPLVDLAAEFSCQVVLPDDSANIDLPTSGPAILLMDDSERFLDTPAGDALTSWVRDCPPGLAVVAGGRTADVALAYRGVAAEIRRARCALLLQPDTVDGELVGIRLRRSHGHAPPGRGVLVGDPAWGAGADPIPIQVAVP
jgi:S-DNA-T family DNA segregation ATPase FtsK/SpoIIIE